jgi:hypothetical protein
MTHAKLAANGTLWAMGIMALNTAGASAQSSAPTATSSDIESVSSLTDLQPRTETERVHAQLLDSGNGRQITPGLTIRVGGVDEPHVAAQDIAQDESASVSQPAHRADSRAQLREQVCEADAVVLGTAMARRTLLGPSGRNLITDLRLEGLTWIARKPEVPLSETLVVPLAGGQVYVGSQMTAQIVWPIPPLRTLQVWFFSRDEKGRALFSTRRPVAVRTGRAAREAANSRKT